MTASKFDTERFWSKVKILGPNDCWEWQASKQYQGYGKYWYNNKDAIAHKVSWMIQYGEEPSDDVVHLCKNHSCVNPDHLVLRSDPKWKLQKFWEKVDRTFGFGPNFDCWKWMGHLNRDGYGAIRFKDKDIGAHRFSWEIHNGEPVPQGLEVSHTCHNPNCVNPEHLLIETHQENMDRRDRAGRLASKKGELNGKSKLNEDQVREIKKQLTLGVSGAELGRQFGVSKAQISWIKLGKSWGHIT